MGVSSLSCLTKAPPSHLILASMWSQLSVPTSVKWGLDRPTAARIERMKGEVGCQALGLGLAQPGTRGTGRL